MRLTEYRKQEIGGIRSRLRQQIGEGEVSVENIAAAMQEQCDNLDYEAALSISDRIWRSMEKFFQICGDRDALTEPGFIGNMLEHITDQMDGQQRKGFFLQALDSFEKNEASAEETAKRAALSEEELKALLEERMREFSKSVILEMGDVLEDSCFRMRDASDKLTGELTGKDAFLFAAAEYVAVLEGVLPYEFGEYPELLGICAAAQMTMCQFCEGCTEDNKEEYPEIIEGLICAAFGAAFAIGAAAIGIAAAPVLEAMAFSMLGVIAASLIATSLYMTFILGCISCLGGLVTAIGAGVSKLKDSYRAKRQTESQAAKRLIQKDEEIYVENQEFSVLT